MLSLFYSLLVPPGSVIERMLPLGMTGLGFLLAALFLWRVFHHIRHVGDRLDFDLLARGVRGRFDPEQQARRYGAFRRKGALKEAGP
jgi:hypothetical protein